MQPDKYESSEQDVVLETFSRLLAAATRDGGRKRARGEKPPWWRDPDHEAAIFSHLSRWKHGERADTSSGAHPLVHLAWRALAVAYQETEGRVEPRPAGYPYDRPTAGPYKVDVGDGLTPAWRDVPIEDLKVRGWKHGLR